MNITLPERKITVPDGEKCTNWDGKKPHFYCNFFENATIFISANEAIESGLGYSAGSMPAYYCKAFNQGITKFKWGDGAYKCDECRNQEGEKV